jgi:hypothetical protein
MVGRAKTRSGRNGYPKSDELTVLMRNIETAQLWPSGAGPAAISVRQAARLVGGSFERDQFRGVRGAN